MRYYKPKLVNGLDQKLSDRELMGYPNFFTSTRLQSTEHLYEKMRYLTLTELALVAESPEKSLDERFVAGNLLSLLGDYRIDVFNPQMVMVSGCQVKLGLSSEDIDKVMIKYPNLGLKREWIEKETPAYEVTIATFRIGKYPVTNQEYLVFLQDTNFPEIPTSWEFGRYPHHRANHPVYTVSDVAADNYVLWLKKKTSRLFRLPTEAEWELAAGGTDGREFPWGNEFLRDHANTIESGLLTSTPVGIFPAGCSPFGASDMAGSVEEYVADDYAPYPGGRWICDDLILSNCTYRIARGGSFTRFRDLARCRRRHGRYPKMLYVMGFRIAEDIQ